MNEIYASQYVASEGECEKVQITRAQQENYAEQLKDYLLQIGSCSANSYDNSDDERAEGSSWTWTNFKYYEINPIDNSEHLVVEGEKVIGVVFYVKDKFDRISKRVFLFDGSVQQSMRLGYSASHSSCWTYIDRVILVKRGENGVPQEGRRLYFKQSEMYPEF